MIDARERVAGRYSGGSSDELNQPRREMSQGQLVERDAHRINVTGDTEEHWKRLN
jgi:hypothetical protein